MGSDCWSPASMMSTSTPSLEASLLQMQDTLLPALALTVDTKCKYSDLYRILQHPAVLEKEMCIKAAKTQEWSESHDLIFKLELQWGNILRLQREGKCEKFSAHHNSRIVSPFNTTEWLIESRQVGQICHEMKHRQLPSINISDISVTFLHNDWTNYIRVKEESSQNYTLYELQKNIANLKSCRATSV